MKVIIYVQESTLENLHKFIKTGERGELIWYHDRPGRGVFYMVSLDYDAFQRLIDK